MKKFLHSILAISLGICATLNAVACDDDDEYDYSYNYYPQSYSSDDFTQSDTKPEENSAPLYTRVDKYGYESASGDCVLFGTYPQSKVTDEALKTTLTQQAGALPTPTTSGNWTSYKYYISGNNTTDFMWYQDVEYNANKYRGVYFTSYRPDTTVKESAINNSEQDDNGYTTFNAYWFIYEPILWEILDKSMEDEKIYATVACNLIIDSREYHYSYAERTVDGDVQSANNYEYSAIREWLNESFYQTAFTALEQELIATVTTDNGLESTQEENNPYVCKDTIDKVWLLSARQKSLYFPFSREGDGQKQSTAYAHCQGVYKSDWTSYKNNGEWWLRSPSPYGYDGANNFCAKYVSHGGNTYYTMITDTSKGVCPALKMYLA